MKQSILPEKLIFFLIVFFQFLIFASLGQEKEVDIATKEHFSYNRNHISIGINDIIRGCSIVHYEHVFKNRFGIEVGAGFTFDDWYALRYWDGAQYIRRNKYADTRFTYSLGLRFIPTKQLSFLYVSIGSWYRKYYSADKDAFLHYGGIWIGSKRIEWNHKIMIGNFFQFGKHFIIDYYAGYGFTQHNDKWTYDIHNPTISFIHGTEKLFKPQFYLGLKIGLSF